MYYQKDFSTEPARNQLSTNWLVEQGVDQIKI